MPITDVKYNNEKWTQTIVIFNPLLEKYNEVQLNNDFVTKVLLSNCIYRYSPRLTIKYTDVNYRLLNFVQLGTTQVLIHMKNETKEDGLNQEKIVHDPNDLYGQFIIDSIETLEQNKTGATILIKCVHANVFQLCKKITYATFKAKGQVSPLRIIQDIFKRIGYPIHPDYAETDRLIDYTSTVGQRVNQMVDYLLRQAVTPQIPPSYLYHNIVNNQAMLYNRQLIPDNILRNENVFYVYSNEGLNQDIERNIISEIRSGSLLGGTYMFDQYGDYKFYEYDHAERKWNETVFKAKQTLDLMTDGFVTKNDNHYTTDLYYDKYTVFNKSGKNPDEFYENKRCYEFSNQNYTYMYDYLKDLELFSSTISFKARGENEREVGQIIQIKSNNKGASSFFGGYWVITEIAHNWENGMYIDELLCHRTVKELREIDEKEVFGEESNK